MLYIKNLLISLLFVSLPLNVIFAQTGAWISQSITGAPGGIALADCGETCAGVTWENSQFVYFFDIDSSQWTEVNLGNQRVFHDLVAEGQTIMAYSDSLLVGYSAITSQWDTIHYAGTLMDSSSNIPHRGYGCGTNLAYFVTDSAMYIFDSELGQWQKSNIIVPISPLSGGYYWSRNDYAAIVVRVTGSNYFINKAYSLHTHSFNELLQGGDYRDPNFSMTHGFVSEWEDGSTYQFNGYSALSNQFSQLTLTPPNGHMTYPIGGPPEQVIERTVYACSYIEILVVGTLWRLHTYGYDTRLGNWTENIFDYDPQEMFNGGGLTVGGQVAASQVYNINPNSPDYNLMTFFIYSGQSGQFNTFTPGLYYPGGLGLGGTVAMGVGVSHVWFYNIETGQSQMLPVWGEHVVQGLAAENYCTIESYEQQSSDSMKLYIYYAPANHCTEITIWKDYYPSPYGTYNIFAFTTGLENTEIYFYSTLVDTFVHLNFPSGSYPGYSLNDQLAIGISSNLSYLYDATLNTVHSENYRFYTTRLGTHIFAQETDDYHIAAYSGVTHQWSDFTVSENLMGVSAKGYIGLAGTHSNNKFYAYNGFHDNLVELDVTGYNRRSVVGGKTALVVRSDIVYAFDPQSPTGVAERNSVSHPGFALAQNYPNPFNQHTKIVFTLPGKTEVSLTIYNISGQKIKAISNKILSKGKHEIIWDGTDDKGKTVSNGVYFYKLRTPDGIKEMRKMLFLK